MADNVQPRIVGLEMEYTLNYRSPENSVNSGVSLSEYFGKVDPDHIIRAGQFVQNGGRYYLDINAHPEFATPECYSFDEAVAYHMAGDQLVADHVGAMVVRGAFDAVFLHKRLVDDVGTTSGMHENYQVDRADYSLDHEGRVVSASLVGEALASHLVSRSVWAGAGSLDANGNFHKTQKMRCIEAFCNNSTTSNKPIVNMRDEPLTDPEHNNARVHVTSGDANVSPWANWLKLASTSLVLRLLENGMFPTSVLLEQPVPAARSIGRGNDLDATILVQHGRRMTALQIQEAIVSQAELLGQLQELPLEEYEAIDEWKQVLDDLKADKDRCVDRVDWVCREKLVEGRADAWGRKKADIGFCLLASHDRKTSSVGRGTGFRWADKGKFRRTPSAEILEHCRTQPPTNTRANIRGSAIRSFSSRENMLLPNWDRLVVEGTVFKMPDAHESSMHRFEAFLKQNEIAA